MKSGIRIGSSLGEVIDVLNSKGQFMRARPAPLSAGQALESGGARGISSAGESRGSQVLTDMRHPCRGQL